MLHWSIGLESVFHFGNLGFAGGVYEWIFEEQVKDGSVRSRGAVDFFSRTPGVKMEAWKVEDGKMGGLGFCGRHGDIMRLYRVG